MYEVYILLTSKIIKTDLKLLTCLNVYLRQLNQRADVYHPTEEFNRECAQLNVNVADGQEEVGDRSLQLVLAHPRYIQRLAAIVLKLGMYRERDLEGDPQQ